MSIQRFQNIGKGKSSDSTDIAELLQIFDENFPLFVHSSTYMRDIFSGSDENHYTETLIKFLEELRLDKFAFKQQIKQQGKRTSDIGIHLRADSEFYIFCIEAKFLPHSPNDYVVGEYAAIKRFKNSEHGISNTNPAKSFPLPQNGIVAYITEKTFTHHQNVVNKQIATLSQKNLPDQFQLMWHSTEFLQPIPTGTVAMSRFVSNHTRGDGTNLMLHHYWIRIS
jgi:hypothetical protein